MKAGKLLYLSRKDVEKINLPMSEIIGALDEMFKRFEYLLEQTFGHMTEISREYRQQLDLDIGPIQPYDEMFAGYDPSAHLTDDLFNTGRELVRLLIAVDEVVHEALRM